MKHRVRYETTAEAQLPSERGFPLNRPRATIEIYLELCDAGVSGLAFAKDLYIIGSQIHYVQIKCFTVRAIEQPGASYDVVARCHVAAALTSTQSPFGYLSLLIVSARGSEGRPAAYKDECDAHF